MRNAERISLFSVYPLFLIMMLLYPLIAMTGNLALTLFGRSASRKKKKNPFATREELKIIIKNEKNLKGRYETTIFHRILDFAEGKIKEHMTPSSRIFSASRKSSVRELVLLIQRSGHSRIPIYEGEKSNIIGVVDAKDLLDTDDPAAFILSKTQKVLVVKKEERIQNLLKDFQKERCHLAIVKDKSGKLTGLITIEDVLEEIVGEIIDEFDKPMEPRVSL
jgi:CBS domain containing-hemolysin-like protein